MKKSSRRKGSVSTQRSRRVRHARARTRSDAGRTKKNAFSPKYRVDVSFPYFKELQSLLLKSTPHDLPQLKRGLARVGKVRLALVTGAFLNLNSPRIDLLIVGDNINFKRLFDFIKNQEAQLGKEIRYVLLNTDEFTYRYNMHDRFLRDILDGPHQRISDSLHIG